MTKMADLSRLQIIAVILVYGFGVPVKAAGHAPSIDEEVLFNRHIRPILSENCFACHGPDEQARQADLRLDTSEGVLAAITSGSHSASTLMDRLTASDPEQKMPPAESGKQLSVHQIDVIRQWIDQGATWQPHWSFILPKRPPVPIVANETWGENTIDTFVLARLRREGFDPSPAANRATLIRRVTLDLTGLPPTSAEVAVFVADTAPDAYERLVDRLLASPRYGERMALDWLDAARYSDTYGYHEDYHRVVWPWRDWVIHALNNNMSFDQFTVEQLAGDLLPNPTNSQLVATGFNRLHGMTSSGIGAEYRVENIVDRVETTATTWLGLTAGCARCHDHKFDPLTQQQFYELYAFFATTSDPALMTGEDVNLPPVVEVVSPPQRTRLDQLDGETANLEEQLARRVDSADADFVRWQADQDPATNLYLSADATAHYTLDDIEGRKALNRVAGGPSGIIHGPGQSRPGYIAGALDFDGETYVDLGDPWNMDRLSPFSYGAWVLAPDNANGAILAKMDDENAYRGFDLYAKDGHVEVHVIHHWPDNALHVKTKDPVEANQWHHIFVTYDGSSRVKGVTLYIDGQSVAVDATYDSLSGTIATDKPLHIGRRNPSGFFTGLIDEVWVYNRQLSHDEVAQLASQNRVADLLAMPAQQRTPEILERLRAYYLENYDRQYRQLTRQLQQAREDQAGIQKSLPTTMVMGELKERPDVFFLNRGQYDQPTHKVHAAVPEWLPSLPAGQSVDRLALAQWLVAPSHPLTARVAVNRFWQIAFGAGIVATAEDFGSQGQPPSHPDLLDYLSVRFVESGWDIKAIMRLIVTSSTYRQSSRATPASIAADPDNRLLARGPRHRLAAEMVRDAALAVSGLLVEHLGGPSVKPYQPAGLWREMVNATYEQDHGAELYRRGLYVYRKRSVPPPNMTAFDAPNHETCTVRRQRTNTPLMALVTLNDPTFVEAARAFAQRLLTEESLQHATPHDRLRTCFRWALSRDPVAAEIQALMQVIKRQQDFYREKPAMADNLLSVGESARDESLDKVQHAAWTVAANVILNMDEFLTKE